jgi:hypothetical protein
MNGRFFAGSCCLVVVASIILVTAFQQGPAERGPVDDEIALASGEGEILIDSPPGLLDPMLASHVLMPRDELQAPEFVGQLAQIENEWNPGEPQRAWPFAVDAPAVPVIAEVIYDGRPFDYWRSLLLNELKPELRLEAVHAVHRFGMNGRSAEAAEAMLTVLDGYSAWIWAELASDGMEFAVKVAMEGQHEDLNADGILIANAIFALFEMSPSVVEHLKSHSRQSWTGIGPMVSMRLLSNTAPDRAILILCDQIRQDTNELQSEVAFERLKDLRHNPTAVAGAIAIATEQPRWRNAMLEMLEGVAFTPNSVRVILETIRSGVNGESLATALCTSGLLQTLANGSDLKTPDVSTEDFHCPELLPVLQTIFDSRSLGIRYREPAVELLIKADPDPVGSLKLLIERRQENDPVRSAAEEALKRFEAANSDSNEAPASAQAD